MRLAVHLVLPDGRETAVGAIDDEASYRVEFRYDDAYLRDPPPTRSRHRSR